MRRTQTISKTAPTGTATVGPGRLPYSIWLLAGLLALVTIILYWPAVHCGFVNFDDRDFITENYHIQGGLNWASLKWAFTNTEHAAYWAPLMWVSHMLAWQEFGANPWGHHLINVLLHAANTALVFLVFRRLTGATWRSFFLAALFGWHPLRVESVAWVTERKDVLSTFFGLLALMCYGRYAQESAVRRLPSGANWLTPGYWLGLLFFALSLMTKAMLVTLPCVLLLLDYWPLKRAARWKSLLVEKIPFFLLAGVAGVLTFAAQKHGSVVTFEGLPLGARVANSLISYCRYLGKIFWPSDLAVFYPLPPFWPWGEVLLAVVFLGGLSAWLFVLRRQLPYLLVGWLWFLGTLVPVIGLTQSGDQAMADRYCYFPSLGVLILVVWGGSELTRRWRFRSRAFAVTGSVALVLCLALARQQLACWKDSESLFRHALAVSENNFLAHNLLGLDLLERGQPEEAISQFQEALRIRPDYSPAHNNLGNGFLKQGQLDAAVAEYQEALRLNPDAPETHCNLGNGFQKKGQLEAAVCEYQEALRLKPDFPQACFNLGDTLARQGQFAEAISQYRDGLRLNPNDADAHSNLGGLLEMQGQLDEAISELKQAVHLNPDDDNTHNSLGNVFLKKGEVEEAIGQFREAVRLKPESAGLRFSLGTALNKNGQTDEAVRQFQESIRLRPDDARAYNNLGIALLKKGQTGDAIGQFQEAIRLKPDYALAQTNLARAQGLKNVPVAR